MEAISFGWAIGDVRAVVQTIHDLVRLFRGAHGAQDNFTLNAAWLESFAHDLQRVHDFMNKTPNATCIKGLQEKLLLIDSGYTQFEEYLNKFDIFLPQTITSSKLCRKRWRTIKVAKQRFRWSWKELNRKVDDLKLAVSMPLAEMNLVLLLDLCTDAQNIYQCVESIPNVSDIAEMKTMVADQLLLLAELTATASEIKKAIRGQEEVFIEEKNLDYDSQKVSNRFLQRLALVEGHLGNYARRNELMTTANANLATAAEIQVNCQKQLSSLGETFAEASKKLLIFVDIILDRLIERHDEIDAIEDLKEGAAQAVKEIDELRQQMRENQKTTQSQSIQQTLQTGLSIAAATTGIAAVFSGLLLQKRWETAVFLTVSSKSDPDRALFEAKWSDHVSSTNSDLHRVGSPNHTEQESGTESRVIESEAKPTSKED